jgi:transposase
VQSARKPYPSDISDEEWALIAPYLVLLREDAGQRLYSLRELFNGLRYVIRHGIPPLGSGPQGRAQCGHPRQPHAPLHARERRARRV